MNNEKYLCFQRGNSYYAVEESGVIRILPATDLIELPIKEEYIKGIILFEDRIIGIIDIEKSSLEEYYIILKVDNEYVGICANKIIESKIIKDFEWLYQENLEFPFYLEEGNLKILHFNFELLKGKLEHD